MVTGYLLASHILYIIVCGLGVGRRNAPDEVAIMIAVEVIRAYLLSWQPTTDNRQPETSGGISEWHQRLVDVGVGISEFSGEW